jgi:hypothetical protein
MDHPIQSVKRPVSRGRNPMIPSQQAFEALDVLRSRVPEIQISGRKVAILFLMSIAVMTRAAAAQDDSREIEQPAVEIKAQEKRMEQQIMQGPVKPIGEPEGPGLPEVPREMKDRELGPAEKERLAELDRRFQDGKMTQTEYDLEVDNLVRESNVKF